MIRFTVLTILGAALLDGSFAQEITTETVQRSFTQARIVPDVIPSFEPGGVFEVFFTEPGSSTRIPVTLGMNLTKAQTSSIPTFGISGLPPSFVPQTFAVALIDPDAPTPESPSPAQFLHFLGGDFELRGELTETTPSLRVPHRTGEYVLLAYDQNTLPTSDTNFGTTSTSFVNSSTPRTNFNITRLAEQVMLTGPVAGTYFYVAPEGSASSSSSTSQQATGTSSDSHAPATTNSAISTVPELFGRASLFFSTLTVLLVML
ncbi:hypothetical protein ONZ45_g13574 [Pleurotus djamor]|nr:hypothetical protein ONZ45_g13574 [Pleurotus djamor]